MTDKQKVLLTLALVSETCSACSAPLEQTPSPQASSPPLAVLRKDFLSLLTLIYTSITKVSLTLRPSESAYNACLVPLQDIAKNVSALTTCATLFDSYGLTLAKQTRLAVKDVLQSVLAYARAFTDITEHGEGSSEDYLVRTGAVHDAVEQVRRDLPTDNLAAIRSLWSKDRQMLEDSLNEVTEMLEADGSENEDEDGGFGDDDDDDDEWDELGFGSKKKMTDVELERTKQIHPLLRLSVLLHKRIHIDLLKKPPRAVADNILHASIDALPGHSHTFLLSAEEVVAALYAPQDVSNLRSAVDSLVKAAENLRPALEAGRFLQSGPAQEPVDELQQKLADITVTETETETVKKLKETQKWFNTCFEQLSKISQRVLTGLGSDEP